MKSIKPLTPELTGIRAKTMKRCKNCIYHTGGERCERLSTFFDANEIDFSLNYYGVALEEFNDKEQGFVYSRNSEKMQQFTTPDWFGCIFHVKKMDE